MRIPVLLGYRVKQNAWADEELERRIPWAIQGFFVKYSILVIFHGLDFLVDTNEWLFST